MEADQDGRLYDSEVPAQLVLAAVFKTVGPYETMRSVGSIPMHFRFAKANVFVA